MTRQQVADSLGICTKTLIKKLLEEKFILKKGIISPKDVEAIYNLLGYPKTITFNKNPK